MKADPRSSSRRTPQPWEGRKFNPVTPRLALLPGLGCAVWTGWWTRDLVPARYVIPAFTLVGLVLLARWPVRGHRAGGTARDVPTHGCPCGQRVLPDADSGGVLPDGSFGAGVARACGRLRLRRGANHG